MPILTLKLLYYFILLMTVVLFNLIQLFLSLSNKKYILFKINKFFFRILLKKNTYD